MAARFALQLTMVILSRHLEHRKWELRVTQLMSCEETVMPFFTLSNGLTGEIQSDCTWLA